MSYAEVVNNLESAIQRYRDATHHVSCIVNINTLQKDINLINHQKAENDSLKVDLAKCSIRLDNLYKTAAEIKSEAIKEFAERLKENYCFTDRWGKIIPKSTVDNLVKEMMEVETNQRKEDEGK